MNRADRGLIALTLGVALGFTIALWGEISLFISAIPQH